jgi:hypothetical protein
MKPVKPACVEQSEKEFAERVKQENTQVKDIATVTYFELREKEPVEDDDRITCYSIIKLIQAFACVNRNTKDNPDGVWKHNGYTIVDGPYAEALIAVCRALRDFNVMPPVDFDVTAAGRVHIWFNNCKVTFEQSTYGMSDNVFIVGQLEPSVEKQITGSPIFYIGEPSMPSFIAELRRLYEMIMELETSNEKEDV